MDIFFIQNTIYKGENFDSLALCVDRLTGWIVAVPCKRGGITAEWLGEQMFEKHWRLFGIPCTIHSDQGAQLIGQWWRTLCAKMGVRIAYSQPYHHQANGRAEVAGQVVINKLRMCNQDTGENWVE